MNRIVVLAALITSAVAVEALAAEEPIAILVAIKGHAEISSRSGRSPAIHGRALMRGDRVEVGPDGGVTLFFNDGNLIELGQKSSLVIGGHVKSKKSPAADNGVSNVFKPISKSLVGGSRESGLVVMAGMRGSTGPAIVLSPRGTQLLGDRPTFTWRAVAGAARYQVRVNGDAGEVWQREVRDTLLAYPGDAPPLPRGTPLQWEVTAMSDRATLLTDEGVFSVTAADDAERIRSQLARIQEATGGPTKEACRYLSGSFLASNQLYADAIVELEALVRLTPLAPGPHQALANVYHAIGLPELADPEHDKALSLGFKP